MRCAYCGRVDEVAQPCAMCRVPQVDRFDKALTAIREVVAEAVDGRPSSPWSNALGPPWSRCCKDSEILRGSTLRCACSACAKSIPGEIAHAPKSPAAERLGSVHEAASGTPRSYPLTLRAESPAAMDHLKAAVGFEAWLPSGPTETLLAFCEHGHATRRFRDVTAKDPGPLCDDVCREAQLLAGAELVAREGCSALVPGTQCAREACRVCRPTPAGYIRTPGGALLPGGTPLSLQRDFDHTLSEMAAAGRQLAEMLGATAWDGEPYEIRRFVASPRDDEGNPAEPLISAEEARELIESRAHRAFLNAVEERIRNARTNGYSPNVLFVHPATARSTGVVDGGMLFGLVIRIDSNCPPGAPYPVDVADLSASSQSWEDRIIEHAARAMGAGKSLGALYIGADDAAMLRKQLTCEHPTVTMALGGLRVVCQACDLGITDEEVEWARLPGTSQRDGFVRAIQLGRGPAPEGQPHAFLAHAETDNIEAPAEQYANDAPQTEWPHR